MPARPLAFRYLYKSGVIKENTVTVFGELGEVFKPGTDYDEEVNLTVPYMDLSNLIMYYTGTVADGTVGSTVEGSLRNLNAPVTNVRNFLKFSNADNASGANHYYIGDIVMFDPVTGEGTSANASCWTCIRTTTDLTSPIPELANEIAAASAAGSTYNNNFNNTGRSGPGMSGIDNRGQRFIVGVMPALYDPNTGDITTNPYWRESALAKSYVTGGNYYQGELVVFNGGVYQCKSTNGFLADPQLYQRTRYTLQQELDDAAGDMSAIPPLDPALAPQGAFGFDSSGTRYLMGVPPAGGLFSGLFWEPATLPRTPSGAYLNINWDNTSITNKLQFYDANVVGGGGAQSIPTFTDDIDNTITTLRKIYDDNEKSFVLTIANQILSSIPAAAIKSQAVNSKVEPDNTLVELVNLGPTNSKPSAYTPAVQGLFEESIARDMLRISGYDNTITELVVTDGSSGYRTPPTVQILGGLATNPKLVPYFASAVAKLGVKGIKIDKLNAAWNSASTGKRYAVGDSLTFIPVGAAPDIAATAKVYRVDSAGNILSVIITNKGSGYRDRPTINIGGVARAFLETELEVVSVDLQYRDQGFYDDMKVVIQHGSGAGAVGYAVTASINGQTRLVEVRFDGTTKTDATANTTYSISRGSNYVSGNFKKDIVSLQGFDANGAVTSAKSIGVVTSVQGGAIASLAVINNGSGYTSNPAVVISRPDADSRENAKLVGAPTVDLTGFLPPIENAGVYTETVVPTFTIADPPADAEATKVQGIAYLGLTVADVRFGGQGFSQGEYMSVSGGGITTARFNVSHDSANDTYSALVMDGGDGYTFNSAEPHLNQFVLKDDRLGAVAGDELRAEITSVGGGIVDLTFNNGRPTGEGFTLDDIIEVTPPAPATTFRFKVTSVGAEGTIAPTGYTVSGSTAITGYVAGQTLTAKSKYFSIDTLSVTTPQAYSTTQPTVTIDAPAGTSPAGLTPAWNNIQATATVSLKVGTISITNAGSGFQLGDNITIRQTGAVSCEAFVLALANTTLGSVGVIAVRNPGSGFDLSATGAGAIEVLLPSTTGTALQVSVSYVADKIVVTNPGRGYETTPTATIEEGGNSQPLSVTTKNAGESTATFRVVSVDNGGVPTVSQLSPGAGYLVDDLLELTNSAGDATGAYVTIQATQSRGVRAGTVLPGYRGKGHTVSTTLIDAACSKIGSAANFPNIKYAVIKVTGPTSISSIVIREYNGANTRYPSPTLLTHKPQARVKVGNVDSIGSILTLTVENPGYGYTSLPLIKPMPGTRGSGASLFAVSLGVTRVEFTGATKAVITSNDVTVTGNGIIPAPQKRAATAVAQLAGDLNIISTDQMKNPNILETLELLKPGSTSGYAQAKPNMGVSSVNVVFAGTAYPTGTTGQGQAITYLEVTDPDLPGGVAPTFDIAFTANDGIANVVVLTSGSGYSKLPKALVKVRTGNTPSVEASVTLNMKLLSAYMTSGGEGYRLPPTVTVTPPDLNVGNSVSTLLPTMKASINGFNIESPGSQYISTPEAVVVGPGNGGEAVAVMGVSDIYVVNGGSGYNVGDMLQFEGPSVSGGSFAAATVLAVNATGSITRVGLAKSRHPVVPAVIAALKNDFILNGGSGYTQLPTISATAKVPDGTNDLYGADNDVNNDLDDSDGTGAVFSVRLGVKNLNFTSGGNGYESDATVLIQAPPSSQAANISGIINSVGQLDDFVINSRGSGYTRLPAVSVVGNGVGATVTPIMGVTEVSIITTGSGYNVGDTVTFTGGNPTEPATAVVTVTEGGNSGIGYDLGLTTSKTITDANLNVDSSGNLGGTVGAIEEVIVIEGGYQFELGDIITIKPETRFPTQQALDSLRVVGGTVGLSAGGNLTSMSILNIFPSNDFKAGLHLKVTPATGSALNADAVAYIRINLVYDGVTGGGWHSINPQYDSSRTNIVSPAYNINTPGDKYGQPYPAYFFTFDGVSATVEQVEGVQGDPITVLASNDKWGSNTSLIASSSADVETTQKLKFEIVTQDEALYPDSTAYFKVTQVLTSVGATIQASPCQEDGTLLTAGQGTGKFFSYFDKHEYTSTPRGRISFIQVLSPGKGYQSNPTAVVNSATSIQTAKLVTTLGVVDFSINQRGSGYTSNPDIRISSPDHRALTAKGYARSGVFDIDTADSFEILDQGAGYTGESLDGSGATQDGGMYRLVGGALHATGGSAESIDTVVTIGAAGFTNGKLKLDIAAVQGAAVTFIRGSNYRVGDVVTLLPIGTTTSDNQARPASIRIKTISKILDTNNGLTNNSTYNTGAGILDYAKQENGEDVGGYGTGYFEPPSVNIFGGNQGVTLATSLGVVALDFRFVDNTRGTNYQVGELIQMISPEFSQPVTIGVVTEVSGIGAIIKYSIYEPFTAGLRAIPSITVVRKAPNPNLTSNSVDVSFLAVLGVTSATTTTSSDGFIGRPYVYIEPPNGRGYVQQPTSARVTPNVVNEVSGVNVFYDNITPEYTTTVPLISITPPPSIEKYAGWRSVRFNKDDSFEAIVQYTIAKAVSFQVDPDATLPGYYFTANAITIGGVVIPLRQSGGKGMQGRELSSNRIIRRYKVKLIAI